MTGMRMSWATTAGLGFLLLGSACRKPAERQTDHGDAAVASAPTSAPTSSATTVTSVVAVTQASPPWDAGAPVVTEGRVDGAELRNRTRERLAKDDSPVHLIEGSQARDLGKAACEAAVPRRPPETPVLIKPNIGGFEWFKDPAKSGGDNGVRGRTTDPEFVRGVIECLQERGHDHITIAEGWAGALKDWPRLIEASGYQAMATATGTKLVAMADDGQHDQGEDAPGKPLRITGMGNTSVPTLLMPQVIADHLDHGLFIMIPKLKAHRFSVVSVGIKNLQGLVMYADASPAYRQKWRSHRELGAALKLLKEDRTEGTKAYLASLDVFARRMVDVLEVEAPHVVLVEGAPAMAGDGFKRLEPSAEKVAIAGTNVIAVDYVSSRFLGLWDNAALRKQIGIGSSPLITKAASSFGVDLSSVRVVGNGAHLIERSRPYYFHSMSGFAIRGDAEESSPPKSPSTKSPSKAPQKDPADRNVRAKRVSAPPTIDGKLDDPAWQGTAPVRFTTDTSGQDTEMGTEVRFAWTTDALYVSFHLDHAGLNSDRTRSLRVDRERLYTEDCVELFLDPDPETPKTYVEVELGPFGHFLDLRVDLTRKHYDVAYASGLTVATVTDSTRNEATIEAELRASDIVQALRVGAELPLGLFRIEGKTKRHYLAYNPAHTKRPNFHLPEAFVKLVLED